jgi:hypothetical protein
MQVLVLEFEGINKLDWERGTKKEERQQNGRNKEDETEWDTVLRVRLGMLLEQWKLCFLTF